MATKNPRSRTKAFKKTGISSAISNEGRGKALYNIWIFRSPKTGKDLTVRADVHFLKCCLLEADSTCVTYEIEKDAETWKDSKKLQTTFDVEVTRANMTVEAMEVKAHDLPYENASESDRDQERRQRIITDAHGLIYVRVHRKDVASKLTLLSSVKMGIAAINAAKHHSLHTLSVEVQALFTRRRVWKAGDILEHFEEPSRPIVLAVLFKKIFAGAIITNLDDTSWCRLTTLEWKGNSTSTDHQYKNFDVINEESIIASPQGHSACENEVQPVKRLLMNGVSYEWANLAKWPKLDEGSLSPVDAEKFSRYRSAITAYLNGGNAEAVSEEVGIHRSELYRTVKRALTLHPDGSIWGWRALKPNVRVRAYERSTAPPRSATEFSVAESGFAGAFSQLLRIHESIRNALYNLALKKGGGSHESRINGTDFHKEFLRLCKSVGISSVEYPFNTADQAERSCRRYLANLRAIDFETGAKILGGIPALVRSRVGTGEESLVTAVTLPFEAVMLDGHTIDCLGSVTFPHPSGPRRIPMTRSRIEAVVEVRSRAVLGYNLIFKTGTNTEDALEAVSNAISKWTPMEPPSPEYPVRYPPGGGLPSGLIPELEGAVWSTMLIDNASIYTTEAMIGRLRNRVGCAVNFGPVGDFTRRYLIEGVYSVLTKRGAQRMPSTTGSGPKDTRRHEAELHSLDLPYDELAYLIDVAIATYNNTEQKSLAGRSPIEYLRELFAGERAPLLARKLPQVAHSQADLDIFVKEITVSGNLREGRRPYLELKEVHYTNHNIKNSAGLINKVIRAHIKRRDLRQFEVFSETGESLGFVKADRGWNRVKHTLEQRVAINRLIRDKRLRRSSDDEDWVQAYLRHLSQEATNDKSGKSSRKVSPAAAKAAHTAYTSDLPIPPVQESAPKEEAASLRPMTAPHDSLAGPNLRPKRKAIF